MTTSETTDDEVDMAAPIGPMAAAEAEAWLCEIDAARGDCDPSAEVRAGYRVEAALRGVVAAHAARVAAEREADGLGRDLVAVAKARDEAVADAKRLREREEHFARALSVADGGQYRADWPGAIGRLLAERDALRARAESAEAEVARLRAEVEALKAAQASARREGAEAMREACATVATEHAAAARARRSAFYEDDRGYDSADAALDAAEEIAAAIRALPLPEARPPATVPCGVCGGRGKVLLGREVEDGCDECGASGRVDAVAEVARLRERVKHHQMQATHHAIVDMDAREAAKRGADALRAQFAEARRLLAAAARGDLPRCDECPHAATLYVATTAGEFHRCDAHAGGDEWETLPHAAALRAAMGGAK